MTIIEKLQEYFDPTITDVDQLMILSDGSVSVTVHYWHQKPKAKIFYDGRGADVTDTAWAKAAAYRYKMCERKRRQTRAYTR